MHTKKKYQKFHTTFYSNSNLICNSNLVLQLTWFFLNIFTEKYDSLLFSFFWLYYVSIVCVCVLSELSLFSHELPYITIMSLIWSLTQTYTLPLFQRTNYSDSPRHWSRDICPSTSQIVWKNFIKISLIIKKCPEEIFYKTGNCPEDFKV